jgi:hypothetical protein
MKKKLTIILSLIMALGMCCFSVTPVLAADTPTPAVTNGAGLVYADQGVSVISGTIDVFVNLDPDTSYYYLINDADQVDVYYNGVTNNPVGSYFDGSLVNGALVLTIGKSVDKYAGIPANSLVGNKITIPAQSSILTVIAYKNDTLSDIYKHVFRLFKAETDKGQITATVDVEKTQPINFDLYLGVYTNKGVLAYFDYADFTASGSMTADVSAYPLGEYRYKVFWWDKNFVPLGEEKSFE